MYTIGNLLKLREAEVAQLSIAVVKYIHINHRHIGYKLYFLNNATRVFLLSVTTPFYPPTVLLSVLSLSLHHTFPSPIQIFNLLSSPSWWYALEHFFGPSAVLTFLANDSTMLISFILIFLYHPSQNVVNIIFHKYV